MCSADGWSSAHACVNRRTPFSRCEHAQALFAFMKVGQVCALAAATTTRTRSIARFTTLDDLREAVTTLEETDRIGRRVFGGSHPHTAEIEKELRYARAALRAREAGKSVVFVKNP